MNQSVDSTWWIRSLSDKLDPCSQPASSSPSPPYLDHLSILWERIRNRQDERRANLKNPETGAAKWYDQAGGHAPATSPDIGLGETFAVLRHVPRARWSLPHFIHSALLRGEHWVPLASRSREERGRTRAAQPSTLIICDIVHSPEACDGGKQVFYACLSAIFWASVESCFLSVILDLAQCESCQDRRAL